MTRQMRLHRGLRIAASFTVLAAILACGGSDEDDQEPPPVEPTPPPPPAPAADTSAPPVIAQFDIAPGFMPDPRRSSGAAGGPTQASTLNANCRGYIPPQPQHTLNLSQDFPNLRVVVSSPQDTTLVIQMADGSYRCDDDGGEGLNPMVEGAFPAGLHRVFVGTYSASAAGTPYYLGVSELNSVTANTIGTPAGGPSGSAGTAPTPSTGRLISLRPGFVPDPHTATGTAGGNLQASTFDSSCRGSIPAVPQHTLMLGSDFQNLNIMVNSTSDTTLVIRTPDGQYRCDDDGGDGFNPTIGGAWAAGTYQIWVGRYGGGGPAPYTIGFSELPSVRSNSLPLP